MAAPVVTIDNKTLQPNQWARINAWLTYLDADGDPAVLYQFYDWGPAADSGYFYTNANAHHPAQTEITVSAADLDSVWVRGGSNAGGGTENMYVRAYDGTAWSDWDHFSLTTQPNTAPVATISDRTLQVNQWAQLSSWISYSDTDGQPAVRYEFWDNGSAADSGYFWTNGNAHHPAGQPIAVDAADLGNVWVRGGSNVGGGAEPMFVRAFDGIGWSPWDQFTLTTQANQRPVAEINDRTLSNSQWVQVSTLINYSDANLDAAVQYQFYDGGAAADSGYFWTNANAHHPAETFITVNSADIASVWVRGSSNAAGSSEHMYVRVSDTYGWGPWDAFLLTTPANGRPTAEIDDQTVRINQWTQVSSWLRYSDPEGTPAVQYQFWDQGGAADSGYFYTNSNAHHPANTEITVNAADLANVWVRGGSSAAGGSEYMYVRAFDGLTWGPWDAFRLSTPANTAPEATINDHTLWDNEWAQVGRWINYYDDEANAVVQYQFMDGFGGANSGYFWTNYNEHHPANTPITVNAADVGGVFVRGGAQADAETMYVRAFDGLEWGAWDSFTLTTQMNTAPLATVANHTLNQNEWSRVNSWISYSDANGHAAVQYEFWDGGVAGNSGYFYTNRNEHHAAETSITVMASDIASVWVRGGAIAGSEQMFVRAFDGHDWGAWDQFTLTTT